VRAQRLARGAAQAKAIDELQIKISLGRIANAETLPGHDHEKPHPEPPIETSLSHRASRRMDTVERKAVAEVDAEGAKRRRGATPSQGLKAR